MVHNVFQQSERVEDLLAGSDRFVIFSLAGDRGSTGHAFVDDKLNAVVSCESGQLGVGSGRDAAVHDEPDSFLATFANLGLGVDNELHDGEEDLTSGLALPGVGVLTLEKPAETHQALEA